MKAKTKYPIVCKCGHTSAEHMRTVKWGPPQECMTCSCAEFEKKVQK